ncbi:MAG TPA: hypothetical protein VKQ28_00760 [Candidatus Acidoferrum sp.]|nr:hypothetical protein [Candidatus Acidoferrum sp.]
MFGGRTKKDGRKDAESAGYMELEGARKDADCQKIRVAGGVSSDLGCCNLFEPKFNGVKKFSCGTCEYVKQKGEK